MTEEIYRGPLGEPFYGPSIELQMSLEAAEERQRTEIRMRCIEAAQCANPADRASLILSVAQRYYEWVMEGNCPPGQVQSRGEGDG
jgi:hypothetical protein